MTDVQEERGQQPAGRRASPAAPVGKSLAAPERKRQPRIALFGVFGSGNLGNEGSLAAMIAALRRVAPEAELRCICTDPDAAAREHGIPASALSQPGFSSRPLQRLNSALFRIPSRLANFFRALRYARRFDALIVPGTGILDDFGEGPWEMPFCVFRWFLAAKLCGTKSAFVSIGAGPIRHPVSRWLMKTAARLASYRSYRDALSRDYMAGLGLDTRHDPVTPDIAFGLPAPLARPLPLQEGTPLTVGLGVMAYYGWENNQESGRALHEAYLEKLAVFAAWLLDEGFRLRLLIGETKDTAAANSLRAMLSARRPALPDNALVFEPAASLAELMEQMAGVCVVVATRFHNVVCALRMGKPVLSVGYAEKNDVLLKEMGLGAFCQHVERLDVDLLKTQFRRLMAERKQHGANIQRQLAVYEERLRAQERWLAERLI